MYPRNIRMLSQSSQKKSLAFSPSRRRILGLVSSGLLLTGCVAGKNDADIGKNAVDAKSAELNQRVTYKADSNSMAEKISGLSYDGQVVTATVISNGCTTKADFAIEHVVTDGHCYATVVRTKPDYCKVTPMPLKVSIAWEQPSDCDSGNLTFTNPLLISGPKAAGRKLPASTGN